MLSIIPWDTFIRTKDPPDLKNTMNEASIVVHVLIIGSLDCLWITFMRGDINAAVSCTMGRKDLILPSAVC